MASIYELLDSTATLETFLALPCYNNLIKFDFSNYPLAVLLEFDDATIPLFFKEQQVNSLADRLLFKKLISHVKHHVARHNAQSSIFLLIYNYLNLFYRHQSTIGK